MSGERIKGNPDAMDNVQKEFEAAAKQWTKALNRFAAGTAINRSVFGSVNGNDQVWNQYQRLRAEVIEYVGLQAWQLETGGAMVGQCSANYRACGNDISTHHR